MRPIHPEARSAKGSGAHVRRASGTRSLGSLGINSGDVNVKQAVPFFSVHDMERSVRFYIDGLGFRVE